MKKIIVSLALLLACCVPAMAQSTEEKIAALRAETKAMKELMTQIVTTQTQQGQQLNGISTVQARMQSDFMDLDAKVDKLTAKLDAVLAATNTKLTTATTAGWDSTTTFSASSGPNQPPPQMSSPQMYGAGSGSCAGGSCGVSTGRGFFRRR